MKKQSGTPTSVAYTDNQDELAIQEDRQGVKSVEVAGRVLEALTAQRISVSLKELSQETRLPPSKLHRYLTSLIRTRLVRQDPRTRFYQLGSFAMELGAAAMHSSDAMIEAVRKQCMVRDAVNETVSLAIWSSNGPIIVHVEESSRSVLMTVRPGTLLPLCATAAGIVFAAFLPPHMTKALAAAELDSLHDDHTPIVKSIGELNELLARVKRDMYVVNRGHLLPGVMAVASPLFDQGGRLIGVLSVIGREHHATPGGERDLISNLLRIAGHTAAPSDR
ncbi:IclR family transcriptional regulator [Pusillimonas noertemannii]|uniref:IclR family transcriptional regulator n=1 Tax=Pusillimonas noertemannii TaxID=305977 RepID=UPI000A00DBD9|nr:IclR family transcriptional regulator [Pusillimonas noertemannii]